MNNTTRNIDTLRLTRFEVVFIAENITGELVECRNITNALNQYDAAYLFGQNNAQKKYVIKEVNEVIQPF
ncbi:hypothetical protein ACKWMY_24950 [Serratia sp. J2]|uniref:hypothetical protein n=1 Tax=Serratia sp. J2 TaxID=3386551 RepID=UPI003916E86A